MKIDENYMKKLVNSVAKTIVEAFENITIEDVKMYQLGYNMAIDDAIKAVNSILLFETVDNRYIDRDLLYKKLEQLKSKTEF